MIISGSETVISFSPMLSACRCGDKFTNVDRLAAQAIMRGVVADTVFSDAASDKAIASCALN